MIASNEMFSIPVLQLNQDKRKIANIHLYNSLNRPLPMFQIVLLQEPKLMEIPANFNIFPPKKFLKNPRAAILCHNSLKGAFIASYSSRDICMVRVTLWNRNFVLISCYAHKNIPVQQVISAFPSNALKNCIIAIDTNAYSPKWGASKTCFRGLQIEEWLSQNELYPMNVLPHPPSFQSRKGSSYIDATFASSSTVSFIQNWSTLNQSAFCSGHTAFRFHLFHPSNITPISLPLPFYNLKTIDKKQFTSIFQDEFWSDPVTIQNFNSVSQIDDAFEKLGKIYSKTLEQTAETYSPRNRINPWWNDHLSRLKRIMQHNLELYRKFPWSFLHQHLYHTSRNLYMHQVIMTKKSWLTQQCQNISNPFHLLKWIKGSSTIGAITLCNNEEPILDAQSNTQALLDNLLTEDTPDNPYHTSIKQKINFHLQKDLQEFPEVLPTEISAALKQLRPFTAPGPDAVRNFMLQWTKSAVTNTLVMLFSLCIRHSYFPAVFKHGNLVVIPKLQATSFDTHKALRPITLLNVMGKLFERILLNRIEPCTSSSLDSSQFGFVKGSSTESVHLQLTNFLESNVHDQYGVAAIKLDIASAFDRVWHPAILKNLIDYGCPLYLTKLIQNYFIDREIHSNYAQGCASKNLSLSVPQGAVLSPLFWKIFLNPLLEALKKLPNSKIFAWADDALLLILYKKKCLHLLKQILEEAFHIIHEWCIFNKASISTTSGKTALVLFQTHTNATLTLQTPFGTITSSNQLKFLGVIYDSKLSFMPHIQTMINNYIHLKHSLIPYYARSLNLSTNFIHKIFSTVIVPKFFYSCATWCSVLLSQNILSKIQVFLNDCARYITRAIKTTPIHLLLALANIPTAKQYIENFTLRCIARILHQPNSELRLLLQLPSRSKSSYIINSLLQSNNLSFRFSPTIDSYQFSATHHDNIGINCNFDRFLSVKNEHFIFFCDGSKSIDNSTLVGISFVLFQGTKFENPIRTLSLCLPSLHSHNEAELWAILAIGLSLKNAHNSDAPNNAKLHKQLYEFGWPISPFDIFPPIHIYAANQQTIHIYSDSMCSLASLQNPQMAQLKHLTCTILEILHTLPFQFQLHWIPGHHGHKGNELADTFAKNAKISPNSPLIFPVPYTTYQPIKVFLKDQNFNQLRANWNAITIERPSIIDFFPSFAHFQKYLKNSHKYPYLNGVISNHLPTHAHLFRMNLTTGPACPTCMCPDDTNHFWFECVKFSTQRKVLLNQLHLPRTHFNMQFIFLTFQHAHYPTLVALNTYIEKTLYNKSAPSKREFNEI
jgi:ribonuclease HI